MKKDTPTNLGPEISRGTGANLMPFVIQFIEKLNSWQICMQLLAIWAWEACHVR